MKIDLSGKTTLITGSTGELGRAMVRAFALCGSDVAVHYYRSESIAKELAHEVESLGKKACVVHADVTVGKDVMRMRDTVNEHLAPPDIIINNAVIQFQWTTVLEQDLRDYDSQYRSCVAHNVLMAKAFVPHMIKQKWGRIIAINTECSMRCLETYSAYVSGKRGMDGVLRVLAREIGEYGITVNQIAPGWIASDKHPDEDTPFHRSYKAGVALKRRGRPEEVANATVFLASDMASFITGVYLPVCGGNVMPTI